MNQRKESDSVLQIDVGTGEVVRANVSDNTLKAYEHASRKLENWLEGRRLTDAVLAEYVRFLSAEGKSPATINLVVAAVKWMAVHQGADYEVGPISTRTLSEIRIEGNKRARRQADGLAWDEVERMCAAAESSDTPAGLRDAAMISLMSDCLLRISEAVAVNVEDVKPEGLLLHRGEGEQLDETLYICDSTRHLIERYRRRAGIESGRLVSEDTLPQACD